MAADLKTYNKKRDFKKSPEPKGKKAAKKGNGFVVQKHAASRLHYDFRLELDGVLKSWAVPKGPSLDPKQRRLAVHVEDHPLDYATFEGTIPKGEYGGGTVMVWDRGTWEPAGDDDRRKAYEKGKLKFVLHGEKLRGVWNLVRMGGKAAEDGDNWLLIKENDDEAKPASKFDITKKLDKSAATGRSLEEIAEQEDSEDDTKTKKSSSTPKKGATKKTSKYVSVVTAKTPRAKKAPLPKNLQPQLATLVKQAPTGDDWLHEIKFDGYRIVCVKNGGTVNLISRNDKDWTAKFPSIAKAAKSIPAEQCILDGEIIVSDSNGNSNFQLLQNAFKSNKSANFLYYVFDLMYCDGFDLVKTPLLDRKEALERLLEAANEDCLRFSDHIQGQGAEVYNHACRMAMEGIISKKTNAAYEHRRSRSWVKTKCSLRQEFVIAGYTPPSGSRKHFGALVLGYYDDGKLHYAGKVGTGFNTQLLKQIYGELTKRERKTTPLSNPPTGAEGRNIHWVTPELVGEVEFTEWTTDGSLRHPSFQGLREDKPAKRVTRESPSTPPSNGNPKKSATTNNEVNKLAALKNGKIAESVAGVRLTNPDRVLYPGQGITKRALAEFYEQIADWVLPHVIKRPLSVVRCPEGQGGSCFYQKHVTENLPPAIRGIEVEEKKKKDKYIIIDDLAGLVSLVQIGVLEIHPWGSTEDKFEKPDILTFDLDPDEGLKWDDVVTAACEMHDFLDDLGLRSFLKTSGGKGLHLVVPLTRRTEWDEAKDFAKAVAVHFTEHDPKRYVATMSKAKRKGRIFIDYLRNARGQTSVAAYSTRAKPNAPVSTPVRWDELTTALKPNAYGVENLPRRLASLKEDPWEGFFTTRQSITASARKKLGLA